MTTTANSFFQLQLINDAAIEQRVRESYASEIASLHEEGFEFLGVLETKHSAWLTPMVSLFSSNEVSRFRQPFNLDWFHPILISADGQTLAFLMGTGVKFYSFLQDGSSIQSSSFHGNNAQMPGEKIEKLCVPEKLGRPAGESSSIVETWLYHLAYIEKKLDENHRFSTENMAGRFIDAQLREDSSALVWLFLIIGWAVPTLVLGGMICFVWNLWPV